jgi:hypothetical protein
MIGFLITAAIITTPIIGLVWLAFVIWEALDN